MTARTFNNTHLAHLDSATIARLHLRRVDLPLLYDLEVPGKPVAQMLGSTRSTVSIAAAHLKDKGLIDYQRGNIRILKKKELEAEACDGYRVVRNHLESFETFDTGFTS